MIMKALKRNLEGYLFIGPWLIGFIVFLLIPVGWSLYLTFTDYSFVRAPHWNGLDNFRKMFGEKTFWSSLKVTSLYAILAVPIHLTLGLLAAMALNVKLKGIGFYRTAYYLPAFVGGSIGVAVMWRMVFSDTGVVNSVLDSLGLGSIQFFSIGNALFTLIGISQWVLGATMLIFLAGLQQVPNELYESSRVDGASAVKRFFSITVPLLTPAIFYNLIMGIVGAMQVFTAGFVITKGGPAKATYFYNLYLYEEAFKYFHMGYASALAWVMFFIILLLTVLMLKSSSLWVFYEAEMKGGKR